MSQTIPDARTGQQVYINDITQGYLMIGDYVFRYSDLLPVIAHYVSGGIMGHLTQDSSQPDLGLGKPPEEMEAIRNFIKHIKSLKETKNKFFGNTHFVQNPNKHPNIFEQKIPTPSPVRGKNGKISKTKNRP